MTVESFTTWANFFVEKIQDIRGDPKNWSLLVIDGHNSHVSNPEALQILNSNRIIAVGLPSHATHLLQVHDVAVFGPLKNGFRQACSDWIKKHGLKYKLDNFPEILSVC